MALKVGELFAEFDLDTSKLSGSIKSIESSFEKVGADLAKTGAAMSLSITAPLVKAGKDILSTGMDFTAQMSRVEAISGATGGEIKALQAAALEMGSTTQFTATQAGEALEYMAMAGWKSDQMLAGLAPIMNLAAASGEDLGRTSVIVTDALTAFGLTAEDAGHFSDVLAVASSNANTNVSMMGDTFKYVAPVAGALGYTVEDVAVGIGLMANSGIKATQAGTSLRAALSMMLKPSDKAATRMEKIGLSLTDASGKVKPFNQLITDMRKSFSHLTEAEKAEYASIIFGQEAMSGMLAIINASDEDIEKLTGAIEECDGATGRMAETVNDNAKGDWVKFTSAVEGAQNALFLLNELAIRDVIQSATEMVGKFNASSDATKQLTLRLGALAAATGPVLAGAGALLMALPGLVPALGALISPLGLVATGLAVFGVAAVDADNVVGKTLASMAKKAQTQLNKIDGLVQSAVKTVSKRMPALAKSLQEGISAALPSLVTLATDTVASMAEMIGDNANELLGIGTSVITSIAKGVSEGAPKLVTSFTGMLRDMAGAFNSDAFRDAARQTVSSLIDGIRNTDWSAVWRDFTGTAQDVLVGVVDLAGTIGDELLAALTNVDWASVPGKIAEAFTSAGNWLKEAILGYSADYAAWSDVGAAIWSGIKSGFSVAKDWLKGMILGDDASEDSTWSDVGARIWQNIKGQFSAASDWLKGLILGDASEDATWIDAGAKIWSNITAQFTAAADWLKKLILGDSAEDATWIDAGAKIWEHIKSGFQATSGWFKGLILGDEATDDSTWGDVGAKIVEKISGALSSINGETIASKIGDLSSLASTIIQRIIDSRASFAAGAADLLTALVNGIRDFTGWDTLKSSFETAAGGVLDALVSGLGTVADAGSRLAGAVASLFEGITAEDLMTSAQTVGGIVIDALGEGIKGVVSGAATLAGGIADVLGKINDADWGASLGTLATNLFDKLCEKINEITTSPDMSKLMENLGNGMYAAISSIGDFAGKIVEYILSPEGLSSIVKAGEGLAGAVIQGLGQGLLALSASVIDFVQYLLGGAIDEVLSWFGVERDHMVDVMNNTMFEGVDGTKMGSQLMNTILANPETYDVTIQEKAAAYAALIEAGFEQQVGEIDITPAAVAMFDSLEQGMLDQDPDAKGQALAAMMVSGYGAYLLNYSPELYAQGVSLVNEYYSGVEEGTDVITPLLQQLGISIPQTLADAVSGDDKWTAVRDNTISGLEGVTEAAEDLYAKAGAMLPESYKNGAIEGAQAAEAELGESLSGMASSATDPETFTDAKDNAQTGGSDIGTSVGTGISEKTEDAQTAITNLLNALDTSYQPITTKFHDTTQLAMDGVSNTFATSQETVAAAAGTAMEKAVSSARSTMNYSVGYGIGNEMMRGIREAVNAAASSLASAASSAVRRAVNAAKSAASSSGSSSGSSGSEASSISAPFGAPVFALAGADSAFQALRLGEDSPTSFSLLASRVSESVGRAAESAASALGRQARIADPSRGTVYSSRKSARTTAEQTAQGVREAQNDEALARSVGDTIADRLIDSGALRVSVYLDREKVSKEMTAPISRNISDKSRATVSGRSAQGVLT